MIKKSQISRRRIVWFILAVVGVLSLSILVGVAAKENEPSEGETLPDTPTLQEKTERRERFTMLLVGSDDAAALSDVMMLLSIDPTSGETWVMQIPRDTYARYSTGGYRKINGAASSLGGMEGLCEYLEKSFGVSINRYARLSLEGFRRVVDALGGVEMTLPEALDYEDPEQGLSIHLPKGTQRLDGRAAEQFVRYRSGYVRGDLGRIDAQKLFLCALFETVSDTHSPVTLGKVALSLLGEVETDLSVGDVLFLADEFFSMDKEKLFLVTAPGSDVTSAKTGASFYVLSEKGMESLLCDHFGGRKNGFDPDRTFLNRENEEFSRIYGEEIPYCAFSASEKNRISIDKR